MVIEYEITNKPNECQHTVPAFILQHFSIEGTFGKKARVYVFDKEKFEVRPHPINVNHIAKEKGFYNVHMDNVIKTIESRRFTKSDDKASKLDNKIIKNERQSLADLDGKASKIVNKIVEEKGFGGLTGNERLSLSEFIIVQMARTKIIRVAISEYFKEQGLIFKLDDNELKKFTINGVIDAEKISSFINNKIWLLFKTSESKPFYISDHPVVFSGGPYRWDLGDTKGIRLYFPISKTLCLVMFCESYKERLLKEALKSKTLMKGLNTGCFIRMCEKKVVYHNMLQVDFALKEVYSCTNNFDIAFEMIANTRLFRKK